MKILMEDWLRGCVHHDGRKGNVYLPIDKVLQIADYIQRTRTSGADGFLYVPPWERVALTDIVRCKDCIHRYVTGETTHYYVCDFMDAQYEDEGYCHHGERSEDE